MDSKPVILDAQQKQMVEDLTALASMASAGKLTAFSFVALTEGEMVYRATATSRVSKLETIGALRRLELHIDDQMFEEELNADDILLTELGAMQVDGDQKH